MKQSIILLAIGMLVVGGAQAGTAGVGTPNNPYFMPGGALIIPTDGSRTNVPSCAAAQAGRFAIDGTTAGGKVQAAAMLTAIAMGRKIAVWGTGTCSVWGDTETIDFFQIIS